MALDGQEQRRRITGRIISGAAVVCAAISGMLVIGQVTSNPRTDDAEVFVNYIGIAPVVNGPITHLYVADNQLVKEGDPLLEIDKRPYAYALARAQSDQQALQGEIGDERPCLGRDPAPRLCLCAGARAIRSAGAPGRDRR